MTELTAADALVRSVVPVDMYARAAARAARPDFYAVYTLPEFWDADFLGVVPGSATDRFPRRVFADLLPKRTPPPVDPGTPLDAVRRVIEADGVAAVPVVAGRAECVGVVTPASLADAVHRRETEEVRTLRAQAARLGEELQRVRRTEEAGRLALGIAHDLNNLLTVVLGGCDFLLARPDLSADARTLLGEMCRAGRSASALSRQLVAIGRPPPTTLRPGGPPTVPPVDLNAVVGETAVLLRRFVGLHVEVALELAPNLPPVRVDPVEMGRVLLNLAANARDAMPRGGRLTVRTATVRLWEDGDVELSASRLREHALLTVTDTGCGMDPATRERLFEPFYTTKAAGQGTGLGLTIVRDIVTRSGGTITVRSEVDKGTTFSLYFPPDRG